MNLTLTHNINIHTNSIYYLIFFFISHYLFDIFFLFFQIIIPQNQITLFSILVNIIQNPLHSVKHLTGSMIL